MNFSLKTRPVVQLLCVCWQIVADVCCDWMIWWWWKLWGAVLFFWTDRCYINYISCGECNVSLHTAFVDKAGTAKQVWGTWCTTLLSGFISNSGFVLVGHFLEAFFTSYVTQVPAWYVRHRQQRGQLFDWVEVWACSYLRNTGRWGSLSLYWWTWGRSSPASLQPHCRTQAGGLQPQDTQILSFIHVKQSATEVSSTGGLVICQTHSNMFLNSDHVLKEGKPSLGKYVLCNKYLKVQVNVPQLSS